MPFDLRATLGAFFFAVFSIVACNSTLAPSAGASIDAGSEDHRAQEVNDAQTPDVQTDAPPPFLVTGEIAGLDGDGMILGLASQTLPIGRGETRFSFPEPVVAGQPYDVVIAAQPKAPWQTCSVSSGSGVANGPISGVKVSCATNRYPVELSISGLHSAGLVLTNRGADPTPVAPSVTRARFASEVASGEAYDVQVGSQPLGQRCRVSGGQGYIANGPSSASVICSDVVHSVGGSVAGLAGAGLILQSHRGEQLAVNANGTFSFPTPERSGAAYEVQVVAQPTNLSQTCVVANASGQVMNADVTGVAVTCTTNTYRVRVLLDGYRGRNLELTLNGGLERALPPSGTLAWTFSSPLPSGSSFTVNVANHPYAPAQTCTFDRLSGTVTDRDVVTQLSCVSRLFSVTVDVQGLTGTDLRLQLNDAETIVVNTPGKHTFRTRLEGDAIYRMTIASQPVPTTETCANLLRGASGISDRDAELELYCGPRRLIFQSSELYTGNLGGLAGADAKCQSLADLAGLGGTFRAWLGDSLTSVESRFAKRAGPWTSVSGQVVCVGSASMLPVGCFSGGFPTEYGLPPPVGTSNCGPTAGYRPPEFGDASARRSHCADWTSTSYALGAFLGPSMPGGFCSRAPCSQTASLVCLEQ